MAHYLEDEDNPYGGNSINQRGYRWYTMWPSGWIEAGWEYKEDAQDRLREMKSEGYPKAKVLSLRYLKTIGRDPDNNNNWGVFERPGLSGCSCHRRSMRRKKSGLSGIDGATPKLHIPAPGLWHQGVFGYTICGRSGRWGTGDHEQIRRSASGAIVRGDDSGWCKTCLSKWAKMMGLESTRRAR